MMQNSVRTSAQSRLKHRKVLGLGENADGHIPKSKISQLLGYDHLNHIAIEQGGYPRGLRCFQWITCFVFGIIGMVNIISPQHFYQTSTPNLMDPNNLVRQVATNVKNWHDKVSTEYSIKERNYHELEAHLMNLEHSLIMLEMPVRLFGVACVSLSALFLIVSLINKDNRRAIRIALVVEGLYFVVDIVVTVFTINPLSMENTRWLTDPTSLFWFTTFKLVGIVLCSYYYYRTNPNRQYCG